MYNCSFPVKENVSRWMLSCKGFCNSCIMRFLQEFDVAALTGSYAETLTASRRNLKKR